MKRKKTITETISFPEGTILTNPRDLLTHTTFADTIALGKKVVDWVVEDIGLTIGQTCYGKESFEIQRDAFKTRGGAVK